MSSNTSDTTILHNNALGWEGGGGAQQCEHDVGVHKSIATDCEQAGRQAARAVLLTSDQRDPLTRHKWVNTQLAGANNDQVSDGSLLYAGYK